MAGITRRILQAHRSADRLQPWQATWTHHHPDFEYCFYDHEACEAFLRDHYPNFVDTYRRLPGAAQRADVFRYLNIYHYGGIWADADAVCKAPLGDYIDLDTELVVGMEMEPGFYTFATEDYPADYAFPFQYLTWAFGPAPRHPALLDLARNIRFDVSRLRDHELEAMYQARRLPLELSGPMAFTYAVKAHLAANSDAAIVELPHLVWGYNPWHDVDVDPVADAEVKVIHLYEGTWKADFDPDSRDAFDELTSLLPAGGAGES